MFGLGGVVAALLIETMGHNAPSHAVEEMPDPVMSQVGAPSANLLVNPSFNAPAPFQTDACTGQTAGELQVPNGWTAYFMCRQPGDADNINRRPEYRPADMTYAYRVRSPQTALKYFNFWALNKSAGVYQVVNGITPGSVLKFSMWVQIWTSNCDVNPPNSQCEPGNLEARLCIDTDGGSKFETGAAGVTCSAWTRQAAWDKYTELTLETVAQSSQVIVALNTRAEWAVKHNDVYADDASLIAIPPTATPTVTPSPTQTPTATATATQVITNTVTPTPTPQSLPRQLLPLLVKP